MDRRLRSLNAVHCACFPLTCVLAAVPRLIRSTVYVRFFTPQAVFHTAILNDTLFLNIVNIVDYSIVVGLDEERRELVSLTCFAFLLYSVIWSSACGIGRKVYPKDVRFSFVAPRHRQCLLPVLLTTNPSSVVHRTGQTGIKLALFGVKIARFLGF